MLCYNSDNRESEERTLTINNVGQTIRNICLDVLQRKCNYSAWFSDSPSIMVTFGLDNDCQVFKKRKVKQDSVFSVKLSFGIRTELRVRNMRPKDTLRLAWEGLRYLRREDPHLHLYIIVKGGMADVTPCSRNMG